MNDNSRKIGWCSGDIVDDGILLWIIKYRQWRKMIDDRVFCMVQDYAVGDLWVLVPRKDG